MKIFPTLFVLASLAFLAGPAANAAAPSVKDLTLEADGSFTFHGVKFQLHHNDAKWRITRQATADAKIEARAEGTKYTGTLAVPSDGALSFQETVTPADENRFTVTYKVELPPEVTTSILAIAFDLPVTEAAGKSILYDGTSLVLPETFDKEQLVARKASTVSVPTADGKVTIEGDFSFVIQDRRKWNKDIFEVHCGFPGSGESSRELTLTLSFEPK